MRNYRYLYAKEWRGDGSAEKWLVTLIIWVSDQSDARG